MEKYRICVQTWYTQLYFNVNINAVQKISNNKFKTKNIDDYISSFSVFLSVHRGC